MIRAILCAALVLAAGCSGAAQAPATDDPFKWSVLSRVLNSTGDIEAIVEVGESNTGARTAPVYIVSIARVGSEKKWGLSWKVWESQVHAPPTVAWVRPDLLSISHQPYTVLEYEPEVTIQGRAYQVELDVLRDK